MAAELTQIIYKEEQRAECYPFANVYFNDKLTIFFENEVIKEVVRNTKADKVGVCSWKLRQKQRWNVPKSREITQELLESDYEVLSFTRNTHHHQMLYAAERWHPGFMEVMTKIVTGIGKNMPMEVKNPIYQNSHSSKTQIYKYYVSNYLIPAMGLIENDPEINKMAMTDSNYSQLAKNSAVTPEYLMDKIGVIYYPLCPFLLERLYSIFIHNEKVNVTYI